MTLLPMENRESILGALKCFGKEKSNLVPPILEDYIKQIARTGQTMLPWIYIKPLLLHKFNKVVDSLAAENDASDHFPIGFNATEFSQRVYTTLKQLNGIPFTIQRICELLENPIRHYSRVDKFLRGFEKVCMVVTTVDPQGNKIRSEDPRFPSRTGLDECGSILSDTTSSPPGSPGFDDIQLHHHISKSSEEDGEEDEEEEATDEEENDDTDILSENTNSSGTDKSSEATSSWRTGLCRVNKPGPLLGEYSPPSGEISCAFHQEQHTPSPIGASSSSSAAKHFGKTEPHSSADLDISSALHDECEKSGSDNEISPNKLDVDVTVSTTAIAITTVPSIGEMLRPIGQLEAFVQNLSTADVSSATSLPNLLGNLTNGTELDAMENESQIHDDACSHHPLIAGVKRRSSSLPLCDLSASESDHKSDALEESPAKRPRLTPDGLSPPLGSDLEERSMTTPPILSPTTMNNSPPIIICGPHIPSRNSDPEIEPTSPGKPDSTEQITGAPETSSPEADAHI